MMRTTLDIAIAKPGGVPEQTRQLDADLRTDLEHADQLLESFLTLARAESGRLEEHNQVALEAILIDGLSARSDQIDAKHLTVETHLAAVEVSGSSTLLMRMIDNVIENAVRHTEHRGSVKITLAPVEGHLVRMTVESSGQSLDRDAVAQLAQPFKRLSQDRTESMNGHGLGLSIVAAVAAAHAGSLELYPRAEGGLRVQITLPKATVAGFAQASE
jgi:signal transduction histidine kinase